MLNRKMQGRWKAITALRSSRARCHPGSRSSLISFEPSDSAPLMGAGRSTARSGDISGLTRYHYRPDLRREQLSHSRWPPGLLPPRTAGHFVFVRPVELDEQTTSHSRTVSLSGAFPDFAPPNPLSGVVLTKKMFSARFREFQALQALAGSYSPHAVTGKYTLLLLARQKTFRRDPVHPLLPCRSPPSVQADVMTSPAGYDRDCSRSRNCPAKLRGGFSSCICRLFRGQVARRRRASALESAIPLSTNQELARG